MDRVDIESGRTKAAQSYNALRETQDRAVRRVWGALRATGCTQVEARDYMLAIGARPEYLTQAGVTVTVLHAGERG